MDTEEHRDAGERIARWLIGGVLLLLALPVLFPVACVTYLNYSPHLLLNETTRALYKYRDISRRDGDVNLVPGFFSGGEHKLEVERSLLEAGLEKWNRTPELPPKAASVQTFRLSAGSRDIVCGNELFLDIAYDTEDKLQSATIHQGGACL